MTPEDRSILRVWCFAALVCLVTLFEYHFTKNLPVSVFMGVYTSLASCALLANAISTIIEEPELIVFAVVGALIYSPLYCLYCFYWG